MASLGTASNERYGDVTTAMYNPDLVDELNAMKKVSWLSYMFDS